MSLIKRFSATLFSHVDEAVSRMENHDAVIEASLRDTRRAAAQAKARLARARGDGERLRAKLASLRDAEHIWVQRARSAADSDEETALECLRRRRGCKRHVVELESTLERHAEVERRLGADIGKLEARLGDIAQQRNLMRTRQSAAEAMRNINALDAVAGSDLEDSFERWETQITEAELAAGRPDLADPLEREFLDAEEREALRIELTHLRSQQED